MESLKLQLKNQIFEIELVPELCPKTIKRLKAYLPFSSDLHYAKIAGEEIMAVMPFHSPIESPLKVSQAKAGMLVFWPQRHLLCLYYGKMQEEEASINLLGYLINGADQFASAGEQVRCDQGKKMTYGTFYFDPLPESVPAIKPTHVTLHPFEYRIWEKLPGEILELITRTGIMRPAGPLLYAEADTHAFHEFMAAAIRKVSAEDESIRLSKGLFVDHLKDFHTKMAGWYLLSQTASVIELYLDRFLQVDEKVIIIDLLQNLMLFIGRLNYWLDALIPWDDFNEHLKRIK